MTPNDKLLIEELRRDEGVRYAPYLDSVGVKTVGVGHNLEAHPLELIYPLNDEQVNQILSDDLVRVFSGLDRKIGWWRNLSYARQRGVVNFVFNVGLTTALMFKRSIIHLKNGNFSAAADEMLNSKWACQVGDRAKRVTELIRNG